MNPFGIGPIEAGILTVLLLIGIVWCWAITSSTITSNVKEICATVRYVWDDLKTVLLTVANAVATWFANRPK